MANAYISYYINSAEQLLKKIICQVLVVQTKMLDILYTIKNNASFYGIYIDKILIGHCRAEN